MNWDRRYDNFLSASAWFNILLYAIPAAGLLAACWYFKIEDRFWTPFLLIYLIGAVAHLLGYGFMAVNAQIKAATDHAIGQMTISKGTAQMQQ